MRGSWWTWLSAVLAIILGLVFGWVAGTGVVHAATAADVPAVTVSAGATPARCAGEGVGSSAGRWQGRW